MTALQKNILIGLIALTSITIGLWAGMQNTQKPNPYAKIGGEFTLTSDKGPVSLSDFKGKVVLLYFGYTHCPDVCITSLTALREAMNKLTTEQRAQVQPLFISVDPERDDAQRVGDYGRFFIPELIGLTGSLGQIDKVAKDYLVVYQKVPGKDSAIGYSMDHSSILYVIGRNGSIDSLVHHGDTVEAITDFTLEALAK